jgi:plastocyanin
MRLRHLAALAAGIVAALLATGLPASASNQQIAAHSSDFTWVPSHVDIHTGESVTWSNDDGPHNVCVFKPGSSGDACDEFRNGDPHLDWSSYTNSHTFTVAGTYNFFCQVHGSKTGAGMSGTVTVTADQTTTTTTTTTGTGTGTSTTPPPETQPTDTTTTPTETQRTTADTTAPSFTGKVKRKSARKSVILTFGSSEAADLEVTVTRRAPGARSFKRVGLATLKVKAGSNTVTLPRKAAGSLRRGSYRVKLVLVDAAGNRSAARSLVFKLA